MGKFPVAEDHGPGYSVGKIFMESLRGVDRKSW
jgi:hypothetical protein